MNIWPAKPLGFIAKEERENGYIFRNNWQSLHRLYPQIDEDSMPNNNNYGKILNMELKKLK